MWLLDTESEIFSIVKKKVTTALSDTYPDLYFTMDDVIQTEPKFPTVYINFVSAVEVGRDLECDSVNAVDLGVQYEITVNKEQGMVAAKKVAGEVSDAFTSLKFEQTSLPMFSNVGTDTKRMIGRCNRILGNGDNLLN